MEGLTLAAALGLVALLLGLRRRIPSPSAAVVLGLALAGLVPAVASADTGSPGVAPHQATHDGYYSYDKWLASSKAPPPSKPVEIISQPCPGYETPISCASPGKVYMEPGRPNHVRYVFLHEIGHQFDYANMDAASRAEFMRLARLSGSWRQPERDHFSPHEIFANSYAMCALHLESRHGKWRYPRGMGGIITEPDLSRQLLPRTMSSVCDLIDSRAGIVSEDSGYPSFAREV